MLFRSPAFPAAATRGLAVTCLLAVWLIAPAAFAWQLYGGFVRSDTGLAETRDGWTAGIGEVFAGHDDWLDFAVGLTYVQKGGSYERVFTSPESAAYIGPAEVRLHVVEPGVDVGVKLRRRAVAARLHAGLAYALTQAFQAIRMRRQAD